MEICPKATANSLAPSRTPPSLEQFDFARVRLLRRKRRQYAVVAWTRPEAVVRAAVPVVVAVSSLFIPCRLLGWDLVTVGLALLLALYVPAVLAAAVVSQWREELENDIIRLEEEHLALTGHEA